MGLTQNKKHWFLLNQKERFTTELMIRATHSPLFVVRELLETRYQGAVLAFMAGSVVRGEASTYSDIDLVVIYDHIEQPFRESFIHKDWPVEAFVHDSDSLQEWFATDAQQGRSSLLEMISEGLEVPAASQLSTELKKQAEKLILQGPIALTGEEIEDRRYRISNLLDDIRDPRSREELIAAAAVLYKELADFYLRGRTLWSAEGKTVLRRLRKADPAFLRRFSEAFEALYTQNQISKAVALTEDLLNEHGGVLFEGYRRQRP